MEVVAFLAPFVLLGIGIIFVAFSGGPGRAREAYLTRGGRFFKFAMVLLYVGLGVAVPALIIADREPAEGGTPPLRDEHASSSLENGKELFRQTCSSCHTLAAANARGVTGPSLDEIGEGRSKPTADANPGARGTAAGVFAHRARRNDKDPASAEEVCEAIRNVGAEPRPRPQRPLDGAYPEQPSPDPSLPELSDVFAAFGSWKRARRQAAADA